MLKRLDRYVIAEFLPTFGLAIGVLTFILLIQRIAQLFDMVVAKGLPALEVAGLFLMVIPTLLPILLPVSLLLSVVLGMGRLSSDSEVTAMRSLGVGLGNNMKPVFAFSLAVGLFAAVVCLWLQPTAERRLRAAIYDTLMGGINLSTETGAFNQLSEGITLYASGKGEREGELRGIFLYSSKKPLEDSAITAQKGFIHAVDSGLALDLYEVEIQQVGTKGPVRRTRAKESQITIPVPSPTPKAMKENEMSTGEIYRRGYAEGSERMARIEFQKRLALPFACLVLGLLGATLGLHHDRSGKSRGVVVSLLIIFAYFAMHTFGLSAAKNGKLAPWLAMWLPNIATGLLAAYAFARKNRERAMPLEKTIAALAARAKGAFFRGAGSP